ncbi:MAG: CpsD/CapB family tyrosine-protein kinase [Oscillospiraceae bacterium]|nr:CpsD/CapB family tyrosine-protein kinase [Oscillospiraceae bacterium]
MSRMDKKKVGASSHKSSYAAQRRNILSKSTGFHVREAFKSLRTNIRFFQSSEGCRKFCITSSVASEGKSITTLNLAITFAESNQRVLLIDADLRRPSLARLLIEKAAPGLSNVLAGLCTEEEAIHKNVYPNLDVMFSGEIPPNPSELFSTGRMKQMIDKLSANYDYILVDTSPVGIVTDACLVASVLDGVLFLVRQYKTEKDTLAKSLNLLENAGVRVMGFVINGYEDDRVGYSKYRYKYRYYKYKHKYAYEATNPTSKSGEKKKKSKIKTAAK